VTTGEVMAAVTTTKTIYSTLVRGHVFKFVAVDELLEIDAGFSRNEPVGLAVRQAIELGVYALVMEGVKNGLWKFEDMDLGSQLLAQYRARYKPDVVQQVAVQKAALSE
jgi:curli production assembly/transport component CsgG